MLLSMKGKDKKVLEDKAELLKALAHPVRLCIVRNLIEAGGCNVTKIQGCLSMPQSTISQHLSKLKAHGIVEGKRSGTEITYYTVHPDAISIVKSIIPLKDK
ncbi:MAG: metalloregulator ArsR/SmtB family transcription factor [Clostridia bacterium]|nr:metalloregulator ArsR/SmtB family transcription factor [Clostridia bacterium]